MSGAAARSHAAPVAADLSRLALRRLADDLLSPYDRALPL